MTSAAANARSRRRSSQRTTITPTRKPPPRGARARHDGGREPRHLAERLVSTRGECISLSVRIAEVVGAPGVPQHHHASCLTVLSWRLRSLRTRHATAWHRGRAAQTERQVRRDHVYTHSFASLVHRRAGVGAYDMACDGAQGHLDAEKVARSHRSNSHCGWGTGREATTG